MVDRDEANTTFRDHSPIAEQLLRVLEDYADEFSNRGVPAHLTHTAREGKYLKGKHIGQEPERFVEEQLIWPALSAFDYTVWTQPYGYPKWDKSRPDFEVRNIDCGIDCAVIGEIKTPNKFEYAEQDIINYLESDLGEPTIGFATDGVRWQVRARPEKSDEITVISDVDLHDVYRLLPNRHEEQESYDKHRTRERMVEAGVEGLHRHTVEERVVGTFSSDSVA